LFLQILAITDPYGINYYLKFFWIDFIDVFVAYFDRYQNTKIFQIQATGDQFFFLDSEVSINLKIYMQIFDIHRITSGMIYKLLLVVRI
jgi:hypothetical protein